MNNINEGDLKNPGELPQIEAPEFILLWSEGHCAGTKDNKTRIYCGERIIWDQMIAHHKKNHETPPERGSWDDLKSEESRKYIEGLTGYEIIPPDNSLIYGRPSLGKRFNLTP